MTLRPLPFILLCALAGGCLDVRDFEGSWSGDIISEASVRQGFTAAARVDELELSQVDLNRLSATLTTSDGKFKNSRLTRVIRYTADPMASMSFDSNPVRSYLHFAPLANETRGCDAMVLISLFGDQHVEMRVIRGNDLFGVFKLNPK